MWIDESARNRGRLGARLVSLTVVAACLGLWSATAYAGTLKRVACQLPFVQGAPNFFCSDLHQIFFFTQGYDPNLATIRSELLAMDEQGNVLSSIPVHAGDFAKLTSNTNPKALKVTQLNNLFTVVAPIPVLHVTADDGVTKSEAFCSNIPFIQTLEPNDAVVSVSNSADDVTHVLAAIPLTDPSHLVIKVDGVDLFAQLGIANAAACTRASPCSGDLVNKIKNACGGGTLPDVKISSLVVDSGPINGYAANTVSFDVAGLGAGGHQFIVKGLARPGTRPKFISPACHDDALDATTLSSGFGITVEKPGDQEPGLSFPVEVKGQICSGNPIAVLSINGDNTFDITTQTCTKGNPSDPKACTPNSTSADTWTFNFDFALPKTDVAQDVTTGDAPFGTFDPGSNRLIVGATDDGGNRTFATRFFGTETTLNTGINPAAPLLQALRAAVQGLAPTTVDVPDAFAIGLSPTAIRQQINQRCAKIMDPNDPKGFPMMVLNAIWPNRPGPSRLQKAVDPCPAGQEPGTCGQVPLTVHVNPSCSTSCDTPIWVVGVDVGANIQCTADFDTDVIHVKVTLPDVTAHLEVSADGLGTPNVCGDCDIGDTKTVVKATTQQTLSGANITFDITKDSILTGNPAPPPPCPDPGQVLPQFPKPGEGQRCVNKGTRKPDPPVVDHTGSDIPCFISKVCEIGAFLLDGLVSVLTFGQVNLDLLSFSFSLDPDLTSQVGIANPEPFGLKKMGVDPEEVKNHNQTLAGTLTSVRITNDGLLGGLKGSFSSTVVDLTIDPTPGALITQPPLPTMPVPGAGDAFILLSTDTLNMLNAGMTVAGALKTTCNPEKNQDGSTKTVGDLLPHAPTGCTAGTPGCTVVCDTLGQCDPNTDPLCKPCNPGDIKCEAVVVAEQGVCHGVNLEPCESLTASTTLLTAIKQGACHGAKGNNCNTIPVSTKLLERLAEQETCKKTPNLGLNKNQPLLICTRQDIPPILLPLGAAPPSPVDSVLRLKALSVALVVDRDNLGHLNTSLADTPQCGPKAPKTGQCAIFESCLDVNAHFNMQYVPPEEVATCGGTPNVKGEPGIKMIFDHVQGKQFPGVLCTTQTTGTTDENVTDQSAKSKAVDKDLPTAAQAAAPPICMQGFDLNKFVKCDEAKTQLLTAETNGDALSKDWLGVTCPIVAP
jgi:hypothetical protein